MILVAYCKPFPRIKPTVRGSENRAWASRRWFGKPEGLEFSPKSDPDLVILARLLGPEMHSNFRPIISIGDPNPIVSVIIYNREYNRFYRRTLSPLSSDNDWKYRPRNQILSWLKFHCARHPRTHRDWFVFNNDPSNATAGSPDDFELKFQPMHFMIAGIKRIESSEVAVILFFLPPADATVLGAGDRHFSEEGNAVQSGSLDRFSSRECCETRTVSLMIYRSIFSFNLAAPSRSWSPTSVRNLSTSWQTIGMELELKSFSVSLSLSLLYVLATAFRGLVSRISLILRRYVMEKKIKRVASRETDNLVRKPTTYPTKMFPFQPHAPSSSTEQSSITELLHFPNFPPTLSLWRDEVRLSRSLAIAVVPAGTRESVHSTKATNCLLFYPNIILTV